MDNYANFWIKCPREAPFYRPVDEVLKWEFIDPPKPLPASAPPTEETPAVETAAVETPAVDAQAPAAEVVIIEGVAVSAHVSRAAAILAP